MVTHPLKYYDHNSEMLGKKNTYKSPQMPWTFILSIKLNMVILPAKNDNWAIYKSFKNIDLTPTSNMFGIARICCEKP